MESADSIVVDCKNGQLVASKEVCRKIDFFNALLNSGLKESASGVVALADVTKEALGLILLFVSLNRPPKSSTSSFLPDSLLPLSDLLYAARFCLEKDLEARTLEKIQLLLKEPLSWKNWASAFAYSAMLGLTELEDSCVCFWLGFQFPKCFRCGKIRSFPTASCRCASCGNVACGLNGCKCGHVSTFLEHALQHSRPLEAYAPFAELLRLEASEALDYLLKQANDNDAVFPDLRNSLFLSSCPSDLAPWFSAVVAERKQEREFVNMIGKLGLVELQKTCLAFQKTSLAPYLLLGVMRKRVYAPEVLELAKCVNDFNVSDISGSVLHEAVRIGSLSMTNYFLSRGADVNLNRGETPLLVAVKNVCPSIELIKLLLTKHADPNLVSGSKQLALHEAIGRGRLDVAKVLLDFNAAVDLKFNGRTALHVAMAQSDDAVRLLLEYGADPNIISGRRELALHIAIASGRMELSKLLLECKADPNLSSNDPTALYVAMAHSDDAVRLVLKYGADPCIASNKGYPLHMMIEAGKLDLAELMLECKAEVNHKFLGGPLFNGRTALHVAMAHSDDAVRLVLKYGADPNIRSNQDELAIHIAVSSGRMEVAKLLLQSKADVNLKNKSGESPLHVAVNCKSGQDVRWLVDVGADLNDKRDSDEATALHLVIATRQHMLFGVLLDQPKLDLEARLRTTNESVFHLAVKQPADLEMAAALVDRVQCIESVDSSGQTALTMLQAQIEAERNLGRKKALMEFSERLINKLAPCIVQ